MSPRCLCEDTPGAGAWAPPSTCQIKVKMVCKANSMHSRRQLRGIGCTNHAAPGKKKCCYFKAEPPPPPLPPPQSLVGHILDSWVNLPSVAYPSKSRWCFMRGFLQWKLQGYWCSTGLEPFLVWETQPSQTSRPRDRRKCLIAGFAIYDCTHINTILTWCNVYICAMCILFAFWYGATTVTTLKTTWLLMKHTMMMGILKQTHSMFFFFFVITSYECWSSKMTK